MKKFLRPKILVTSLIALIVLLGAWSNNPPDGRTGAPGDGLCTDCHSPANNSLDGSVEILGLPSTIMPNTTYNLTIQVNNPNGAAINGGFQLTALNAANNSIGTLSNADANSTITNSGGRMYWEHNPSQSYGGSNSLSFTADWTSPPNGTNETITLYAAGLVANGNGSTSGDRVFTNTTSGMLMSSGDPLNVTIPEFDDVLCFGGNDGSATAQATGGDMMYSYLWDNGENTAFASMLNAGVHTVTVTDGNSNTATASVTISEPALLEVSLNFSNPTCFGNDDGMISLNVTGGTFPYSFEWSNASSTPTIPTLQAGLYTVTVTDDNGCMATASQMITEPDEVIFTVLSQSDVLCFGDNTGTAEVQATGGTGNFTYAWSDGGSGSLRNDLNAQTYMVTATDDNSCQKSLEVVINQPDIIMGNILSSINPTCSNSNDGFIEVNGTGGTGNISYTWNNGFSGSSQSNLAEGTYAITMTDENNCTSALSVELIAPPTIMVNLLSLTDVSCFGEQDGAISVDAVGGAGNFSYSWSNGMTSSSISFLPATTYSLTVTDGNGCTEVAQYAVNQPSELMLDLTATAVTSAGGMDGTATCAPSGSVAPYTFLWSNGDTTSMIFDLDTGTYSVMVTDGNGCVNDGSVTVNGFGCDIQLTPNAQMVSCAGVCDGQACVTPINGTPPFDFDWGDSLPADSCVIGLCSGDYSVTLTDANNCKATTTITISEPSPINIAVDSVQDASANASDGFILVSVSNANGSVQYNWIDEQSGTILSSTEDLIDVPFGYYSLTVMDENDCSATIDSIYVDMMSSSIAVQHDLGLSAYPNPTQDILQIEMPDQSNGNGTLSIIDFNGKVIQSEQILLNDKILVNVSRLDAGIYLLKINQRESTWFAKFFKN